MSILDKFAPLRAAYGTLREAGRDPFAVRFERMLSPTEGVLAGGERSSSPASGVGA